MSDSGGVDSHVTTRGRVSGWLGTLATNVPRVAATIPASPAQGTDSEGAS